MEYHEWPFIEARRILGRLERIGKSSVVLETGYGPSGLPHIGTFGEVARTSFVLQALRSLAPDVKAGIIAFSDDMDGLREVPANVPNREMLLPHLGKPLTSIPDPFGEERSYAHHMNRKLRDFLDSFGFQYRFASSTEQYCTGAFNEGLKKVMDNYVAITEMFTATIAEEKRASWSPFFPVCGNCGRVYSTKVTAIDADARTVSYACSAAAEGKYGSCGHKGTMSILDGHCKLGWKVDWALRWYCLGVDYEVHGEDLLDSVRVSTRIAKLLGGEPPETFKYELFLDEKGKKISKKIGNGVSIEQWLRYAPVDSLLYIMYLNPQRAKKIGLPLMPEIIDQYLELVAGYDGAEDSPVPFITRLSRGAHAGKAKGGQVITYTMIFELVAALNITDAAIVRDYLVRYQPEVKDNLAYYDQLIEDALAYYREVYLPGRKPEEPGHSQDEALKGLAALLAKCKDGGTAPAGASGTAPAGASGTAPAGASGTALDPDSIQTLVFQAAKNQGVAPKEWFRTLYRLFLGQSSGPRIGAFLLLIGLDKAVERIRAHTGG